MDFTRNSTEAQSTTRSAATNEKHKGSRGTGLGKWTRVGYAVLLFAITILIAAIAGEIAFGTNNESKYVSASQYQAVFLNNGSGTQQTYIGHITKLTDKYLVLQNVYYLSPVTTSSSSTTTSSTAAYQLDELGCQQLYGSDDQMVINQDQVVSLENLQNNGSVVTAINQFVQQNPNGPNCSQSSVTTLSGSLQNTGTTIVTSEAVMLPKE